MDGRDSEQIFAHEKASGVGPVACVSPYSVLVRTAGVCVRICMCVYVYVYVCRVSRQTGCGC